MPTFEIDHIRATEAIEFIRTHHYSKVMPRHSRIIYGGKVSGKLVAVMTLGLGVQPVRTIAKLFPSLGTKDYLELGKLCLLDEMPRNSESAFIAGCLTKLRQEQPQLKLLFTWADGMLGKPGYVYQAANFLYGGFIWTDSYFTNEGEKIHPRSSAVLCDRMAQAEGKRNAWLSESFMRQYGMARYRGKQFRYIYFLCHKAEAKTLLAESTVEWTRVYPKRTHLEWKKLDAGKFQTSAQPFYARSLTGKELRVRYGKQEELFHV